MKWSRTLPKGTDRDVLDVIAKALMIRLGGSVTLSMQEMQEAGAIQAEFAFDEQGNMTFRVERS